MARSGADRQARQAALIALAALCSLGGPALAAEPPILRFQAPSTEELAARTRAIVQPEVAEVIGDNPFAQPPFELAFIDLNGDQRLEMVAQFISPTFCNQSWECRTLIFTPTEGGSRKIGDVYTAALKIDGDTSSGYHDIVLIGSAGQTLRLAYDGQSYADGLGGFVPTGIAPTGATPSAASPPRPQP